MFSAIALSSLLVYPPHIALRFAGAGRRAPDHPHHVRARKIYRPAASAPRGAAMFNFSDGQRPEERADAAACQGLADRRAPEAGCGADVSLGLDLHVVT